ncbi:hypothetical protein MS2017_0974 [Bathymodiolus thermophilus thioautotrophic gill symbiont]|uniref:Uncharacterized protein n=1 Tax=Bathymodiolus thermophilus thioautotrophic gill symbiont TaxID=2360 RepID=A0A3G3IMJ4_9GAMM|nr:hypothetical protein [Bathymodiolus thermophilus thioautotrophic gill symbiont]AYQ56692.1 hypothetical protein MS2017_0974 [Bathymodiolus thermophilus thioautotrophic gill symbiont]
MNNIEHQLSQVELVFENVAFLIAKEAQAKEIHSTVIKGLIILSEVKKSITEKDIKEDKYSQSETDEIKKVERKLKLWSKEERQKNINSRILNEFLKLKKYGNKDITETDIQNKLLDVEDFKSNFDQMKNIAEKNNGKIFEQNGDNIEIWKPVSKFVSKYEKIVFQE